jgi:hypothetical protein
MAGCISQSGGIVGVLIPKNVWVIEDSALGIRQQVQQGCSVSGIRKKQPPSGSFGRRSDTGILPDNLLADKVKMRLE